MSKPAILLDGTPTEVIEMLGDGFEIVPWTDQPDADGLSRCVGVLAYSHPTCDGELMDLMPNLKVVSNYGVGVDHIDVAAAAERGIPVGNTPGCLDASTADMSMALILAVARNVVIGDKYAHSAAYTHHDPSILIGREVTGSTLGIIGMGRIGKQVAKRANGFDMRILYHNRNRDEQAEQELGVTYSEFDDLLRESDFVSLNCPLTDETTGMISDREFELMKSSAILVNLARGPVVNSDALCRALSSGSIAAAGLDVTDPEPLPRDHPLLEQENAIILPHLGSASDRTRTRMAEMSVENLLAGLDSRELPYRVIPR
jgi:glyoxylate reductase